MQCACAILAVVACSALKYFSTLSHKRRHFRKKIEFKICFDFFLQLLSEIYYNKSPSINTTIP